MATFKIEVGNKRKDDTYLLSIELYHNGQRRYIQTPHHVVRKQLTSKLKLKDEYYIKKLNDDIVGYKNKMLKLSGNYSADYLKDFLLKEDEVKEIDFIAFSRSFIASQKESTGKNTETALNALISFLDMDTIDIKHINLKLLENFAKYLKTERTVTRNGKDYKLTPMGDTGVKDYLGKIRQLFIAARNKYNDEDSGKIVITHYPFHKLKIPKAQVAKKRNVKVEIIKTIRDTPNISRRADLGRDVFMLSFYLVGINTVDLFNATDFKNGRLSYNRGKTASRKADKAFISIKVELEAQQYFEKYKDLTGKRIFNFYHNYTNADNFNKAVNNGLSTVCQYEDKKKKRQKIDEVTSYYARHSWATIARNICKISKDDVHFALNHSDPDMKVTDLYIEEDFSIIDEANRKVLDTLK